MKIARDTPRFLSLPGKKRSLISLAIRIETMQRIQGNIYAVPRGELNKRAWRR